MRGIVKYLMMLWMSILFTSCIFDAEQCVLSTEEPHNISFTISLSGQRPGTRATWNDDYTSEVGVPFDFRILPDELRVVVFAPDGTRLGTVREVDYWPINESHTEYQFVGLLPSEFVTHLNENGGADPYYKFMVLANCGDHSKGEEYITYSYTQLNPTNADSSIPMWGVSVADVTPLFSKDHLDIGDIGLLRAAAKVEVSLSDQLKSRHTEIVAANLKYFNQTGYVLPNGWSQVSSTAGLNQENCMRNYRHAALNLPFVKDEKTGNYYIYVTEYDNIDYSGERNKISLEFKINGENRYYEDAISFCQYSGGKPVENSHYNIVRNHIYEFEILSIAGSNLVLEYTVADWDAEVWDGNGAEFEEHDLSYPTYHNPVVPNEFFGLSATEQENYVIDNEPTMYYSAGHPEDGGFHCYFQILAPETVEWKPVFMGSKENYRICVYYKSSTQPSNEELVYDTEGTQVNLGACQAGDWFHIVVFPLSDDGANENIIEFGISYYQMWTDQYINLFVNGEYDNIRWPNSGNNPKIINIRHISSPQGNSE
ncbi:MAG: hypothetical protein J6U53_01140 [Tidjanibacter sp.]|nr:hypothetical protein [Tidjanibacter sp.]